MTRHENGDFPTRLRIALSLLGAAALHAIIALAPPGASADPSAPAEGATTILAVGDVLPELVLKDQHGAEHRIDSAVRVLLLTRDMDAGDLVKQALAEGGRQTLASAAAVYVADVSGMPAFVRSMFALPSMRKRDYAVVLDEDGKATAHVPYEAGRVTVLRLEAGRIQSISHATTLTEVRAALQP